MKMTAYVRIACMAVVAMTLLLTASITAALSTLLPISINFQMKTAAHLFDPCPAVKVIRRDLI